MKKLPISSDPYIKSYTYHAYQNAIINNENTTSEIVAKIKIPEEQHDTLQIQCEDIDIVKNGCEFEMKADLYETNSKCCIYRKMRKKDLFVIEILKQQYVNFWGNINIFIAANPEQSENIIYTYGNFCGNGLFLKNGENMCEVNKENSEAAYPLYLKLSIDSERITGYYSKDGIKWYKSYENIDQAITSEELYIGVKIELNDNCYFNWLYANYIQLMLSYKWISNVNCIPLDYYVSPQKKWNYYTVHNLIDFKCESKKMISDYRPNIIDYIMLQINNQYYVELMLNEKYIPDRNAYQICDHNHANLIYGYDEMQKTIYIMGYNRIGWPVSEEITYEQFINAYNTANSDADVHTLKYSPDVKVYRLDLEHIIAPLEAYLEGRNLSLGIRNMFVPLNAIFGIDIYDELIKSERAMDAFMDDRRISYLLFEHKKIMRDRMRYLIKRGFINTEASKDMLGNMDKIYNMSEIVNKLVLKYDITKDADIRTKVKLFMKIIKELEIDCYNKLLQLLKQERKDGVG